MAYTEPTEMDVLLMGRHYVTGFGQIGPLTREQAESEERYERHMAESLAEHEAQMAAGGRTVCPRCGQRSVTHRSVLTYGVPGHPGSEYSGLAECERCEYREL